MHFLFQSSLQPIENSELLQTRKKKGGDTDGTHTKNKNHTQKKPNPPQKKKKNPQKKPPKQTNPTSQNLKKHQQFNLLMCAAF